MPSSCPLGFFVATLFSPSGLDGPCISVMRQSSVANTWERAHPCALQSSSIRFVSTLTNRGVALGARASLRATIIIHTLRINAHKPRCGEQGCARSQRYDHHPYTSNQRSQTEVWRARMRALPALQSSSIRFVSTLTNRGVARKDARAPSSTWLLRGLPSITDLLRISWKSL